MKTGTTLDRDRELTPREERFCYEYVLYLNATKAAILAGYSENSARQLAARLLSKVNIQNRIGYLQEHLAETAGISALRVLKEHEKIAFSDAGQLRDGWMSLKEFERLTDGQRAVIQEVSTRQARRITDTGEAIIEEWVKIKLYDKQKSLDSIKSMLGFDAPVRTEVTGKDGRDLLMEPVTIEIIDSREKVDGKDTDNQGIR
jgi:phage terminase small subunit